jgi:hypothetical protein
MRSPPPMAAATISVSTKLRHSVFANVEIGHGN